MSIKKTFFWSYSGIITGIVGVAILSSLMGFYSQKLEKKQEQRYQSYLLANRLRQSSDELTRMARTYVTTGDDRYEKMYWDILGIRNGTQPRPQDYHRIYWDLVINPGEKPKPDGPKVSLKTLMVKAGFTEAEFAKLQEAERNSNQLVATETIAMNAVKGLFRDGSGNFTVRGEPDFALARRLMFDLAYHQEKARIMQPIDEFLQLLEERTTNEVLFYERRAGMVLLGINGLVLVLIIFSITIALRVSHSIFRKVGGEPLWVMETAQAIAQGDLTLNTGDGRSLEEDTESILGNIQAMTRQLSQVVHRVKDVTFSINDKSDVMDQASAEMLEGATTQASASEEAAISMAHMAQNMDENVHHSQEAAQVAREAAKNAQSTGIIMVKALESIQEIAQRITVIEEITLQTQVLSLNASIEATKSKEHGQGFAVIASEIRNLAQRSQQAATQINQLARSSVQVTEQAGKMLSNLVPEIEKTAVLIEQINRHTVAQTQNSNQINQAIQQLRQVMDRNGTVAQNLKEIAAALSLESNNLARTVEFFRVSDRL